MFENILGHELFLCDRGVFIIEREACMQRKRDISIYFLPVACSPSPKRSRVPAKRERGGQFWEGGAILGVGQGVYFCTSREYVIKGDASCVLDYLSWAENDGLD